MGLALDEATLQQAGHGAADCHLVHRRAVRDLAGRRARLGDVATDPVGQHAQPVGQELFQVEQDVRGTQAGPDPAFSPGPYLPAPGLYRCGTDSEPRHEYRSPDRLAPQPRHAGHHLREPDGHRRLRVRRIRRPGRPWPGAARVLPEDGLQRGAQAQAASDYRLSPGRRQLPDQ
ncbi:hypothetical protein G6F31_017624 [Rhizopus arrhizus]|nr:hypothetical protein G6F31_017624 [Rhizopus arrhizus]